MRLVLYLMVCCLAIGCSSKFVPGNYTPFVPSGVSFAGEKFDFNEDGTFKHISYTDVSDDGAFLELYRSTKEESTTKNISDLTKGLKNTFSLDQAIENK